MTRENMSRRQFFSRQTLPALWRRFPTMGPFRPNTGQVIPPGLEREYPLLAERITFVRTAVEEEFETAEYRAQVSQNRYRRQQVTVIVGSLLTTVFATAQSSFATVAWIGVIVATLSAATAAITTVIRQRGAFSDYIAARRKAERLRSLSFSYVCRPAPAEGNTDEQRHALRLRVAEICHKAN
jgi:Protein of unknown function (DUF4231)